MPYCYRWPVQKKIPRLFFEFNRQYFSSFPFHVYTKGWREEGFIDNTRRSTEAGKQNELYTLWKYSTCDWFECQGISLYVPKLWHLFSFLQRIWNKYTNLTRIMFFPSNRLRKMSGDRCKYVRINDICFYLFICFSWLI